MRFPECAVMVVLVATVPVLAEKEKSKAEIQAEVGAKEKAGKEAANKARAEAKEQAGTKAAPGGTAPAPAVGSEAAAASKEVKKEAIEANKEAKKSAGEASEAKQDLVKDAQGAKKEAFEAAKKAETAPTKEAAKAPTAKGKGTPAAEGKAVNQQKGVGGTAEPKAKAAADAGSRAQAPKAEPGAKKSSRPADGVRVSRASVCTAIKDREPDGAAAKFGKGTAKLYCFSHVEGAMDSARVKHTWYHKGEAVGGTELPVRSNSWRTHSAKVLGDNPSGEWKVEVSDAETGEVLETVQFTVE